MKELDLLSIYDEHCPCQVSDMDEEFYAHAYRAYCFGVYDALRSIAAKLKDEETVRLLEQHHRAVLGEE